MSTPERRGSYRASDISHLPHLVAAALVSMQDEESLKVIGRGFLDMTRIAAGDGGCGATYWSIIGSD